VRWSASSLVRHCAHRNVLSKLRPRPARTVAAADRGTLFHAAVERWIRSGEVPQVEDPEVQGWLDMLAIDWTPPPRAGVELALGLSPTRKFVEVEEPEPHVYVPTDGKSPLLTAGRADVVWAEGDVVVVRDWKTGVWPVAPAAENLQVLALAFAAADLTWARAFRAEIYYVRDGYRDSSGEVVLGTPEAERLWGEVEAAALLDETPRPGPWCGGCWERRGCAHAATTEAA